MADADTQTQRPAIDFAAEGLLDGLEGDARDERAALLEYLADQGIGLDELKQASGDGSLIFLPADRAIGGRDRYTRQEIVEQTGIDERFLDSLRQAMGLPAVGPEEAVYADADLEASRLAEQARQAGITEEEIIEVTRLLGRGLAHAAEAMRAITLRLVLEPGLTETELAQRFAQASEGLAPLTTPLVGHMLTTQLRQIAQGEAISATERSGGQLPGSREVAIGFADLVGFTRVGEEVTPDELGRVASRLEAITAQCISQPVTLVKTLGDAVMLVSPEPGALVDAALTLVEVADREGEDFPQLRVGLALGTALRRAGDWYGQPVNLASRVTSVARPGSVLATRAVRDAAREQFKWSFAGERKLRGVREPVAMFRARRLDES